MSMYDEHVRALAPTLRSLTDCWLISWNTDSRQRKRKSRLMSECLVQDLDSVRAERDNKAAEAQSLRLSLEQLQTKLQVGKHTHLSR